jgi:ribose transport system ATP-binding protein
MNNLILQIKNLTKYFGNVKVLTDINLNLKKGSILGLVGENGSGKSTLMNLLGGIYKQTSGSILLNNESYEPDSTIDAENAGIAFIHQELNIFTNLTVAENIFLDNHSLSRGVFTYKNINAYAKKTLDYLGLDVDVKANMENLSQGKKQMVEIAKAVSKKARIVIFDEPTTSLSKNEKQKLFKIIRDLHQRQISMIYISHTLEDVLSLCDEVAVLRDGALIGREEVGQITKADIIKMMVGRELDDFFPYIKKEIGKELFRIESLNQGRTLTNINITVNAGEIVGLFGLMGSGRTELARAIYGLDKIDSGKIYFDGAQIQKPDPIVWNRLNFAFITEDRRHEGLLLDKSVKDNIILSSLKQMTGTMGSFDFKTAENACTDMVTQLNIKTYDKSKQTVRTLSGGNQQKVVLGKWLMKNLRFILLDEPTRGIDVGAKFDIYTYMNELSSNGVGVFLISSEMEELVGICERILVMAKGEIVGDFLKSNFDTKKIISLAIGGA